MNNGNMENVKTKKSRKWLTIVLPCACLIAIAAVLAVIFIGRSPESTARKVVRASLDGDGEGLVHLLPGDYIRALAENEGVRKGIIRDELEDRFDNELEFLEDRVNDDTLRITSVASRELSGDEEDRAEELYRDHGVEIKDAGLVTVSFTVRADGSSHQVSLDIPIIKSGWFWYFDALSADLGRALGEALGISQ